MPAALSPLLDALRQFKLLTTAQLKELENVPSAVAGPENLAKELIQRGWLTPYQTNLLLQTKGQELLLGSYVLLDCLGEGGMGQVFKARNWKLGKIVALKLIHKEQVANPSAVVRFQREVRAAAQLSHPNVVMAYDADEVGGTHLLVMEYVEGSDLAALVKKQGPLSVEQACDFIRQAALGLQHAFEKGLVHRDIKPSNLLLAPGAVVKVLDMGLARLDSSGGDENGTMTHEGAIMGTPDYIAPEQAMDSHTVDIRGDIYSLGCTFYFLLTGRAPFPGGTTMEKLFQHRLEEPQPVEQFRPDVSSGMAAVVRKMMAKMPEDRYQTPAEVATALLALGRSAGWQGPDRDGQTMVEAGSAPNASPAGVRAADHTVETQLTSQKQRQEADQRRSIRLTMAGGALLVGGVGLFVGLLIWQGSPQQEATTSSVERAPVVTRPRDTPTKVDEAWLKQVAALPAEKQVEAVAAKLKELNIGFDGKMAAPPKIEKDVVTEFSLVTNNVTDISPVRALAGLKALHCNSADRGKGKLFDLTPLKGMKLTRLYCEGTQVADLSPLKGMPLTILYCHNTKVSDLSPLEGMPLTILTSGDTKVSDLSPLKGMPLVGLTFNNTPVSDLTPLEGMKLEGILFTPKQVIKSMDILRQMKTLKTIGVGMEAKDYWPADEFWKRYDSGQFNK